MYHIQQLALTHSFVYFWSSSLLLLLYYIVNKMCGLISDKSTTVLCVILSLSHTVYMYIRMFVLCCVFCLLSFCSTFYCNKSLCRINNIRIMIYICWIRIYCMKKCVYKILCMQNFLLTFYTYFFLFDVRHISL